MLLMRYFFSITDRYHNYTLESFFSIFENGILREVLTKEPRDSRHLPETIKIALYLPINFNICLNSQQGRPIIIWRWLIFHMYINRIHVNNQEQNIIRESVINVAAIINDYFFTDKLLLMIYL